MRAWLIAARHAKKLSQKSVSEAIGVSQPTYWGYEHGTCTPTPANAKKIGKLLKFSWAKFYEEV